MTMLAARIWQRESSLSLAHVYHRMVDRHTPEHESLPLQQFASGALSQIATGGKRLLRNGNIVCTFVLFTVSETHRSLSEIGFQNQSRAVHYGV